MYNSSLKFVPQQRLVFTIVVYLDNGRIFVALENRYEVEVVEWQLLSILGSNFSTFLKIMHKFMTHYLAVCLCI